MKIKDMINTIVCGNCVEVMKTIPDNYIDLVVTSPPYNKKGVGGKLVKKIKYDGNTDSMDEKKYQEWQVDVLNELYRVSKMVFYNHKVRYEKEAIFPTQWIAKTKWKIWQEIVWNRSITGNIRGWRCWNIDERIYWLVKDKPSELNTKLAQYTSIWNIRPEIKRRNHPAPFPQEIANRCLLLGSNGGDIILDPFLGSGTTAVACKMLKRNYIGIEISPEYCQIANDRLKQTEEPLF